jgi:hypothetical protein
VKRSDIFARVLRAAVLVTGVWAIYAQVSVLTRRTFHDLLSNAWIPALVVVLLVFISRKISIQNGSEVSKENPSTTLQRVGLVALFSIIGFVIWRPGHPIAAAIYGVAVLWMLVSISDRINASAIPKENQSKQDSWGVVLIVMVASMIVALCEHRVNWDDAKYLHIVANTLEHPDEPMLLYENLHGVSGLKIFHPTVQLQTYELLVATIAKVFGIGHVQVYYLILPPIWAALSVIAQWILLRRIAGQHAALALIAVFVVLCVMGGHRSYGAFAFDFVGRGIFTTFAIPALISASLDYAEKRNIENWMYLFLITWTGCLLTSSAYAVVPVAVCLVLIACYGFSFSKVRDFLLGLLAVVWCPLLLAYVTFIAPVVIPLDVDSPGNAHTMFPRTQGKIALILFGLAPFFVLLARWHSARWLLRYTGLVSVILMNGVLLTFVGQHSSILSWRLLWAVPVPVVIGTGIAASIALVQHRYNSLAWVRLMAAPLGVAIIFLAFVFRGETAVFRNFGWPSPKMHKSAYNTARSFVQCSKPTDLVLAPPEIAIPMAGLVGAPSQIAVRSHHLAYLSAQWGREETGRRNRLFNIAQGKQASPEAIRWAKKQLEASTINRIFLDKEDQKIGPFRETLRSMNLDHVQMGSWEIWVLHTSPQESMQLRSCLNQAETLRH